MKHIIIFFALLHILITEKHACWPFTWRYTNRYGTWRKAQLLDSMDLERERGITIKSHAIQMEYTGKNNPEFDWYSGHVDFSYEVSIYCGLWRRFWL
jgi:hypothetical protein